MAKVMYVFFDMNSMVGKDFETGLADLKAGDQKEARRATPPWLQDA